MRPSLLNHLTPKTSTKSKAAKGKKLGLTLNPLSQKGGKEAGKEGFAQTLDALTEPSRKTRKATSNKSQKRPLGVTQEQELVGPRGQVAKTAVGLEANVAELEPSIESQSSQPNRESHAPTLGMPTSPGTAPAHSASRAGTKPRVLGSEGLSDSGEASLVDAEDAGEAPPIVSQGLPAALSSAPAPLIRASTQIRTVQTAKASPQWSRPLAGAAGGNVAKGNATSVASGSPRLGDKQELATSVHSSSRGLQPPTSAVGARESAHLNGVSLRRPEHVPVGAAAQAQSSTPAPVVPTMAPGHLRAAARHSVPHPRNPSAMGLEGRTPQRSAGERLVALQERGAARATANAVRSIHRGNGHGDPQRAVQAQAATLADSSAGTVASPATSKSLPDTAPTESLGLRRSASASETTRAPVLSRIAAARPRLAALTTPRPRALAARVGTSSSTPTTIPAGASVARQAATMRAPARSTKSGQPSQNSATSPQLNTVSSQDRGGVEVSNDPVQASSATTVEATINHARIDQVAPASEMGAHQLHVEPQAPPTLLERAAAAGTSWRLAPSSDAMALDQKAAPAARFETRALRSMVGKTAATSIRLQLAQTGGVANVRILDDLGEMLVRVEVRDGEAEISVEVDDLPLAATLESALDDLVRSLEESGVTTRKVDVGVFSNERRSARNPEDAADGSVGKPTADESDHELETTPKDAIPRVLGPNRGSVVNVVV